MSAHVRFIKFINRVGEKMKCEACQAFYPFFATENVTSLPYNK